MWMDSSDNVPLEKVYRAVSQIDLNPSQYNPKPLDKD
jgi:hypothetical protein